MKHFVQKREGAASPQNGQLSKANRQVVGANAKVPMKRATNAQQPQQPQAQSNIPSRSFGRAQDVAATLQYQGNRRHSGQSLKRDPYDTDAESIDTTVNQSVAQVDDIQQLQQQHHHYGEVADSDGVPGGEFDGEDKLGNYSNPDGFTEEEKEYLQQNEMWGLPREHRINILEQARAQQRGFGTIDGDSYPSTTNGDLNDDWDGDQQPPAGNTYNPPASPSPPPVATSNPKPRTFLGGRDQNVANPSAIFQHSANLRNEQRLNRESGLQFRQIHHRGDLVDAPSSQPPSYSQANTQLFVAPVANHNPVHGDAVPRAQPQQQAARRLNGPANTVSARPVPVEATALNNHSMPVRPQFAPAIQHPTITQTPNESTHRPHDVDYDYTTLFALDYERLKNESFDTNPRESSAVPAHDMVHKPLNERLDFAKDNLDPDQQSQFFRSLPTAEWEDAGDWFLDKFSDIIRSVKEARQKKRKLAREFEEEVEKRHAHVSKKQHQVEGAMNKMKAQGEGLVAKSPRRGRSPKPKK